MSEKTSGLGWSVRRFAFKEPHHLERVYDAFGQCVAYKIVNDAEDARALAAEAELRRLKEGQGE